VQALGCLAVLRLVLVSPFQIGGYMDRLLVTLLLGAAGSGLLVTSFSHTNSGPVQIAPFFLLAVITPLILRAFRLGGSYRQVFAVCAGVGVIMAVTSYVWVVLDPRSAALRMPLAGHVEALVVVFALVLFGSALAATLASQPIAPTRSVFGQIMAGLVAGCGGFAVVSFIGRLWYTYARAGWLLSASFAVLEALYFAVLALVLVVPALLLVRRRLRGPLPLAMSAAVLFPLPLVAELVLWRGGRGVAALWQLQASFPAGFAVRTLPWLVAAVVLGWCLGMLRLDDRSLAEATQ
jgi:hypothetical protein